MPSAGSCPVEVEPAELSICDGAPTFLQSGFWGSFKARFGWKARSFLFRRGGDPERPLLVLTRPLAPGFAFAYIPWGPPEIRPDSRTDPGGPARFLAALAGALRPRLERNTGFIRFDPPWYGIGVPAPVIGPPLVKASGIQAPDTVLLDLGPPPEAILAGMKQKWRYNIGLAARRGVTVRCFRACGGCPEMEQALGLFYRLLKETALRDGIAVHSFDYYRGLFAHAAQYQVPPGGMLPELRLYLAEYRGQYLAGIVTLYRGPEGIYLYGASSGQYHNLMAPYALQWQAIQDARESGCTFYDFFGIPPSEDPHHPMAGLYRFKTGFIGDSTDRIIHRPGSWDYPYHPLPARLFRTAEILRKRLGDLKKR
jgi:lipid II:glycine glycyltransferase (peptidoglycan interpeptide bridge formation enzyme)